MKNNVQYNYGVQSSLDVTLNVRYDSHLEKSNWRCWPANKPCRVLRIDPRAATFRCSYGRKRDRYFGITLTWDDERLVIGDRPIAHETSKRLNTGTDTALFITRRFLFLNESPRPVARVFRDEKSAKLVRGWTDHATITVTEFGIHVSVERSHRRPPSRVPQIVARPVDRTVFGVRVARYARRAFVEIVVVHRRHGRKSRWSRYLKNETNRVGRKCRDRFVSEYVENVTSSSANNTNTTIITLHNATSNSSANNVHRGELHFRFVTKFGPRRGLRI